jgi:hypothetical protein
LCFFVFSIVDFWTICSVDGNFILNHVLLVYTNTNILLMYAKLPGFSRVNIYTWLVHGIESSISFSLVFNIDIRLLWCCVRRCLGTHTHTHTHTPDLKTATPACLHTYLYTPHTFILIYSILKLFSLYLY